MQGGVKRLGGAHRDLQDNGTNTAHMVGGCGWTLPMPPNSPHIVRVAAQRDPPQPLCRGEGAQGGDDAGATRCPMATARRTDKDTHPPHAQCTRVFARCTPGAHPDTRRVTVGAAHGHAAPRVHKADGAEGRSTQKHTDTHGAHGDVCASDTSVHKDRSVRQTGVCTQKCAHAHCSAPPSPRCITMGRRKRRRRRKGESSPHPLPPAQPGVRPANAGAMSVGTAAMTPASWGRGPTSVGGGPGPVPRCPLTAGVGAVSVQRLRRGQRAGQRTAAWRRLQQQHHVGGWWGTPSAAQLWGHWEAGNLRERLDGGDGEDGLQRAGGGTWRLMGG